MIYYKVDDIPARAWRKSRVVCAVEGCSLFTYSLTVPFGQAVSGGDLVAHLAHDLDALDWGADACWDGVEMTGFNAAMGRQCRFAVLRAPVGQAHFPCDVAWPVEAGLLGEAEALMVGDLPDAPAESCENMGWALWRGSRLTVLLCREGRPVHWLCEEGWDDSGALAGRLARLTAFVRNDALLGGGSLRWFVSGERPVDNMRILASALGGAEARPCDLRRGLDRLEHSAWGRQLPNLATRAPAARRLASRRLWFRTAVTSCAAALVVALACLGVWARNNHLDAVLTQERLGATDAMAVLAQREAQQDSLAGQALALAGYGPLANPGWAAGPWLSALGALLPAGTRLEQVVVENRPTGYGVAVSLTVREFAEADDLAKAVGALPGVRAVRMGDKKSGPGGVRIRLEVDL